MSRSFKEGRLQTQKVTILAHLICEFSLGLPTTSTLDGVNGRQLPRTGDRIQSLLRWMRSDIFAVSEAAIVLGRIVRAAKIHYTGGMSNEATPGPPAPNPGSNLPPASNTTRAPSGVTSSCSSAPACPVCGGHLIDIRGKLQCTACHRICETCCEGGRG
ncbi:hypothetical protein NB063_31090 [Rhodopirellula sp. ICT_H3.1]|uniref:Uncharacterized protein n=1 Tax=Aporhodopirellula aestuarii TaxID=2950107 RepID=A0ABT0UDU7_9BACT|nr:hypothetical protein [Aporhodopirellula aestuarii]